MGSDEDVVRHIRDLLLRGERMLDEHCPRCGTPLFLIKSVNLKYCPKCRVYLATPEELKRAKIDRSKMVVYDFDEYWKMKEEGGEKVVKKEVRGGAALDRGEARLGRGISNLSDALNELILVLIDKIIEKVDKQDLELEKLFKMLKEVAEIRNILLG